jgi:hypothetical protein
LYLVIEHLALILDPILLIIMLAPAASARVRGLAHRSSG